MNTEVVFHIQGTSEHSKLEIVVNDLPMGFHPSLPQYGPHLPFNPVALCWLNWSLYFSPIVNAMYAFQTQCPFQYSVLFLSAQMISSFFPTKPNGSHLSSTRPTTHSSHKAFFDCSVPLGAFLSGSNGLGLKHSFQVVLCSRNAAKSFPTLP